MPDASHLILAATLAVLVAFAARRARALSVSGAIAAALVGFLLFGLGGGRAATALLLFFVSSSALSRWRRREKERLGWEKSGGERDAGQVLANGGVATLATLFVPIFPDASWPHVAILGALATANADTWATEIGALSRAAPRLITTLRPAPPGMSGAVSALGTGAALVGALVVAAVALSGRAGLDGLVAAGTGGFLGALADSLIGATLQAQFRCPVCGKLTEQRAHCPGQPAERERGLPFLGNDAVNFAATGIGAAISVAIFLATG